MFIGTTSMHIPIQITEMPTIVCSKPNARVVSLDTLTQDVQKHIIKYLDPADLKHISLTTRSLYLATSDASVCSVVIGRALYNTYAIAAQRGLSQAIVYDEVRAGVVTTSYMQPDGSWGKSVELLILLAHRWNVLDRVVRDGYDLRASTYRSTEWLNSAGHNQAIGWAGGLSCADFRTRLCSDIQRVIFTRGITSLYWDCFLSKHELTEQHGDSQDFSSRISMNRHSAYRVRIASKRYSNGHQHACSTDCNCNRCDTDTAKALVKPIDLTTHARGVAKCSSDTPEIIYSEIALDLMHCGLHTAALKGYTELVQMMCSHAHEWNRARTCGMALACLQGHSDTMKQLCVIEDPAADENNALFVASAAGYPECVALLLRDSSSDPQAVDSKALQFSSSEGHENVVRQLLEDGRSDPCAKSSFGLRWAARSGHARTVDLLLRDKRADPSAQASEALRSACVAGYGKVVQLLLIDGRADPSARGCEGFLKAAELGHTEVVKHLLIDGRVDPSTDRNKALRLATKRRRVEIIEALLRDGRGGQWAFY